MRATTAMKRKYNLSNDFDVCFSEVELKTSEVEANVEHVVYTTGEMLRSVFFR